MNSEHYYDRKLPLVLLTGGADSTLLAYKLLQTSPIDILYITGNQCPKKVIAEQAAIVKIVKWLNANCHFKVRHDDACTMTIDPLGHSAFAQPPAWLFGTLFNCRHSVRESVNMAYVCGDQFSQHTKTIAEIWDKLCEVSLYVKIPLLFPLITYRKTDVYNSLPIPLRKLIWSCELPVATAKADQFKQCGVCAACKTRLITLEFLKLN